MTRSSPCGYRRRACTTLALASSFAVTLAKPAPSFGQPAGDGQAPLEIPPPAATPSCVPHCRDGYVCHQGQCISACNPPCDPGQACTGAGTCQLSTVRLTLPPVPAQPTTTPADPQPGAPGNDVPGGTNLHVNALGLLQFGLVPRIEFGNSTTLLLGLHLFNTGVLSYVVIPGPEEEDELDWGLGANVGARHYFNTRGAQAGAYVGGLLEYAYLETNDYTVDVAAYHRHYLIPAADAGYRWVWGRFLMDVGGVLGAALVVDAEDQAIAGWDREGCAYPDSCLEESENTAFAMAMLDLGFFL